MMRMKYKLLWRIYLWIAVPVAALSILGSLRESFPPDVLDYVDFAFRVLGVLGLSG
jgi:hypothetical protein